MGESSRQRRETNRCTHARTHTTPPPPPPPPENIINTSHFPSPPTQTVARSRVGRNLLTITSNNLLRMRIGTHAKLRPFKLVPKEKADQAPNDKKPSQEPEAEMEKKTGYEPDFVEPPPKHLQSVFYCKVNAPYEDDKPSLEGVKTGYECEPPPKSLRHKCSICLQIVREPHLISCCGNNFCAVLCVLNVFRKMTSPVRCATVLVSLPWLTRA